MGENRLSLRESFSLLFRLMPLFPRGWKGASFSLLVLFPPFVSFLVRFSPTPREISPSVKFVFLLENLFCQYLVWLLPYLFVTEFYRREVEKGRLAYLWLSSLPPWHFFVYHVVFASLICFFSLSLSLLGTALLLGAELSLLPLSLLAVFLASLYYGAAFASLGVVFHRPMAAGVLYGFFIETLFSSFSDIPARKLPALFKVYSLVAPLDPRRTPKDLKAFYPVEEAVLWLLIASFVVGGVGAYLIGKQELRGKERLL